jgi:hypothetical protein
MGDNFVFFNREVRCCLSESSRIQFDSHVCDLFGPGHDLNLALLLIFKSEWAVGVGMEEQGLVLHGSLLWTGGLGGEGLDENGEAEEQCERETACLAGLTGDAGAAKWKSHAPKVANSEWPLLVKSRQITRAGALKKLLRGGAGEEAEVAHHVRLIAVTGFEGDLRKGLSGIPQPADML